ncbi:hypothetical protein [Ferviditalea candida]|uniref:Uncharacterized protein n=1 Tax=Ferviditalea candida TaxID=3108399 RepID=A0ABU5ZHM1_9BACL|nr:hypothetical protein [Paenibacillaceae bacterium T2]
MELVGRCAQCQKEIFCRDGFLEGAVDEDKRLLCFDCLGNQPAKDSGQRKKPTN